MHYSLLFRLRSYISSLGYLWASLLFLLAYRQFSRSSLDFSRGATTLIRASLPARSFFDLGYLELKSSRVAHIYGSGRSINKWHLNASRLYDPSSLHVCFNWSGLVDFPFDVYFCEVYGEKGLFGKASQIARYRHANGSKVILKMLYCHYTDSGLDSLSSLVNDGIICLDTFYCPDYRRYSPVFDSCYKRLYLDLLFGSTLEPRVWPEAFSSPLTIIALLRKVGYEKFVLHGFDLDHGDYFFRYSHDSIARELLSYIPDEIEKPPMQGTNHDSKKSLRLNLPMMLSLADKLGYANISYAQS